MSWRLIESYLVSDQPGSRPRATHFFPEAALNGEDFLFTVLRAIDPDIVSFTGKVFPASWEPHRRLIVESDMPDAGGSIFVCQGPRRASLKSPVEMPFKYNQGSSSSLVFSFLK